MEVFYGSKVASLAWGVLPDAGNWNGNAIALDFIIAAAPKVNSLFPVVPKLVTNFFWFY